MTTPPEITTGSTAETNHAALRDLDSPPSSEAIYFASNFTVESILQWPIFSEVSAEVASLAKVPTMELLGRSQQPKGTISQPTVLYVTAGEVESLVNRFLKFNFIKNPVLDIDILRQEAQSVIENGLQWDGGSCLVVSISHSTVVFSLNNIHSSWSAQLDVFLHPSYTQSEILIT